MKSLKILKQKIFILSNLYFCFALSTPQSSVVVELTCTTIYPYLIIVFQKQVLNLEKEKNKLLLL